MKHKHTFLIQREEFPSDDAYNERAGFLVMLCECGAVTFYPFWQFFKTTRAYKTALLANLSTAGLHLHVPSLVLPWYRKDILNATSLSDEQKQSSLEIFDAIGGSEQSDE